ncbi:MAG TPA: PDZ domain-containing protein [Gemmataceae bacterium]|nr:PDZ domain-containing protein [Gemmataceae bacterium]
MNLHPLLPWRLAARAALTLTLLAVLVAPGWSEDPKPRDQQIADIQKQIEALSKQLNELKKPGETVAEFIPTGALPQNWVSALTWRSIGPATMGGRMTAISVFPGDSSVYWVATGGGGLLKTTNNGTTFEHQFDHENTVAIGDVCVAPSNQKIVWVGTGENNPRNSVSYGDGVYKSTDGGKKWQHMGLRETFQIGKVIVHPTDPNTVYVGALGRLYGPNPERGVFKTTNGGETWEKVLFVDDKTGVIDMRLDPSHPDTLWAAFWGRQRDEFDSFLGDSAATGGGDRYGPSANHTASGGIYKTTDGGKNWKKLTNGLPTVATGRIGLDIYAKDPKVVFAVIDTEKAGTGNPPPPQPYMGVQGESESGAVKLTVITENGPAAKAGLQAEDVVTAMDGQPVTNYEEWTESFAAKKVGDKVKLAVKRGNETMEITVTLEARPAGGGGRGGFGGGQQPPAPYLGIQGEDAGPGTKVTAITENSPAAKAGLKENDVITAMDGQPADTFEKLFEAYSAKRVGDSIKLTVKRGDESKDISVTLEARQPQAGGGGGGGGRGGRGPTASRPYSSGLGGQIQNAQNQQGPDAFQTGGVYKSTDGGETWTRINSLNPRPMYFSQVRVDPSDDKYLYVLGVQYYLSSDGGKTFRVGPGNGNVHSDHHALWVDPKDGRHMLIGTDGGFYVTYDRMEHWEHLTLAALGQFYHVCVDNRKPYRVIGGLQDNGSWSGPSRTLRNSGPMNEEWFMVSGGDGFVCRVDPDDPDVVYSESQDGNVSRRNLRTDGRGAPIRPGGGGRGGRGAGGGGGGAFGGIFGGGPQHRFNWNTPFILSSHNPRILYVGAEQVFRSVKQGDDLKSVSPEITRTKRGSATALAESPRNPDVLWAGTDDGALWVTRDGGQKWTNVSEKVGLPGPRWVSTIEASRFVEGRAYVCFDAHRSNDDKPYLYVTEDFGQTWKSLNANLPAFGSSRCLREDVQNANLLFCGTEFAVFASVNRGGYWTKINHNLPTVAVHELAIHPTAGEMVAATHGRSLWILDVSALRQVRPEVLTTSAYLFAPAPATKWRSEPNVGSIYGNGSKKFFGENPPPGAAIYLSLTKKPQSISLKVFDVAGQLVRELPVGSQVGLQRVNWNLGRAGAGGRGGGGGGGGRGGRGGGGAAGGGAEGAAGGVAEGLEALMRRGGLLGGAIQPGTYRVVLNVDGKEHVQPLRIEPDPTQGTGAIAVGGGDDHQDDDADDEEREKRGFVDR